MSDEIRTLDDFVEDLVTDGRTPKEVKIVAMNTRWQNEADKAERLAAHLRKGMAKK